MAMSRLFVALRALIATLLASCSFKTVSKAPRFDIMIWIIIFERWCLVRKDLRILHSLLVFIDLGCFQHLLDRECPLAETGRSQQR